MSKRKETGAESTTRAIAEIHGGKVSAGIMSPGELGAAAARGWVDIVGGWASVTDLGRAHIAMLDNRI